MIKDSISPEASNHHCGTTVRRNQEPPRNNNGNIICEHAECQDDPPTFRFPSEWNKHMDRHERPYKCSESGCENKLGFVSRGDFLRHQREVHNKGSKPRASLFCPYEDCARSHSKPFVRTENLRSHIRRVHVHEPNGTSSDEPCGNLSAEARIPINASLGSHGNHNLATSISHESFLQMEAESLRNRIMKQDRRIEELQRQKMELEAKSHGTKPNNLN